MWHSAVLSRLTGYCAALHHVSIASVCHFGSLCVSVDLNVSVLWTELQPVPLVSHGDPSWGNFFCFISIIFTNRNMFGFFHTAPVFSPGFACFYVHASVGHSEPIYIFLINIYWWHVLPFFFFYFFCNYLGICVLDPAVAHCSPFYKLKKTLLFRIKDDSSVRKQKVVDG